MEVRFHALSAQQHKLNNFFYCGEDEIVDIHWTWKALHTVGFIFILLVYLSLTLRASHMYREPHMAFKHSCMFEERGTLYNSHTGLSGAV